MPILPVALLQAAILHAMLLLAYLQLLFHLVSVLGPPGRGSTIIWVLAGPLLADAGLFHLLLVLLDLLEDVTDALLSRVAQLAPLGTLI